MTLTGKSLVGYSAGSVNRVSEPVRLTGSWLRSRQQVRRGDCTAVHDLVGRDLV